MSVLPLYYIPPVSWFVSYFQLEHGTVSLSEKFPKQTLRNRCRVLTANGVLSLIVPVQKGRSGKVPYEEIRISYAEKWQQVHVRTLISAYRNSPFFEDYFPKYEEILLNQHEKLAELNKQLLAQLFCDLERSSCLRFNHEISPEVSKFSNFQLTAPGYVQVFSDRFDFVPDLCVLDVLFNLGPESFSYIQACHLHSPLL